MNRTYIATLTTALLVAHAVSAQAQSVNLQQAFEAARSYDAAFISAQAALQASKERAIQAKAGLLPTLNLTSTANRTYYEVVNPAFTRPYSTAGLTLAGAYPIFRPANNEVFNQAQASVRIVEASLLAAKQDLITRVSQAYFDVLLSQDNLHRPNVSLR
jgi:outer membrane protein